VGDINAEFQTRLHRRRRDLNRPIAVNRAHLLAGSFPHVPALYAHEQLVAALADLRAGRLRHQHLAVVRLRARRFKRGRSFARPSRKVQCCKNPVARGIFALPDKTELNLPPSPRSPEKCSRPTGNKTAAGKR